MSAASASAARLPDKIGLGCVTFGREIDEAAAHALLDHAWARGVRHFDTAAAYADGASERIIGRWLTSRRHADVRIATKLLPAIEPANIRATVEASMQRLGVDTLDLLYLHRWDVVSESPAFLRALDALLRTGALRRFGVCNYSLDQLHTAIALQEELELQPFTVVQNNHNLAVSDLSAELLDFCAARRISVVSYSPLGAGFLTGKHRAGVSPGSRFELIPGHQNIYFHEAAYRRLDRLEAVAQRSGHSRVQLALAWALHSPGIETILVGCRTPTQLDQAFAALVFNDLDILSELTSTDP